MGKFTMSHNACYACLHVAAPLSFNSARHFLGFTGKANNDVTFVKYSFYQHKGLFWYCVTTCDGHAMNSLFFVDLANCVRDLRSLCDAMCWELQESSDLLDFVSRFNKSNN